MLQRIRSNNLTTIRIRLRGGRRLAGLIQGRKRTQLIGATFAALLGCITFHPSTAQGQDAPSIVGSSPLYSLSGATGWINSKPLTANDLKGKVVLVDFWDYSCINCIRAIPISAPGPTNTKTADLWSSVFIRPSSARLARSRRRLHRTRMSAGHTAPRTQLICSHKGAQDVGLPQISR